MGKNTKSGKLTGLSEKSSDIILVVLCTIILLIVAYPLYYVLIASVSNPYDVYAGKTFLLPSQFTLDGYKSVFADPGILLGLFNSFKYDHRYGVLCGYALSGGISLKRERSAGTEIFQYLFYHYHVFWRRYGPHLSRCEGDRAD